MIASINHGVLFFLNAVATSSTPFSWFFIFIGSWLPYFVIFSVIVYEFFEHPKHTEIIPNIFRTLLPAFLLGLCVLVMKELVPMPRPFALESMIVPLIHVGDPFGSFPSAHATFFSALAGSLYVARFHFATWYIVCAIMIGIARIAIGVHWPIDVFAGLLFGFFGGVGITQLIVFRKNKKMQRTSPVQK